MAGSVDALISELWTRLTSDTQLKTLMGGQVRLFYVWAQTDAPFPYLVHRIQERAGEPWPMVEGWYYIDVWDYASSAQRCLQIRERIVALVDQMRLQLPDVAAVRFDLAWDDAVAEDTPQIWHHALQFRVRYYRTSEAAQILARP